MNSPRSLRLFSSLVSLVFLLGCQAPRFGVDDQVEVLKVLIQPRSHSPAAAPGTAGGTFALTFTTNAAPEQLTVGSWNIEHLGSQGKRSGPASGILQKPADLADYIKFSKVDVLGLIEIYGNTPDRRKNQSLEKAFAALNASTGSEWKYKLFGQGNVQLVGIAWNAKRVTQTGAVTRIEFENAPTTGPQGNRIWDRHPHVVKFSYRPQSGMTDFAVVVLHMKADYQGDFADHREVEAELLAAAIPSIRSNIDKDIILIGDANCKGHSEGAVQRFVQAGFKDLNQGDQATHWRFGPLDRAMVPNRPVFSNARFTVARETFLQNRNIDDTEFKKRFSDHFLISFRIAVVADDD